VGDTIELIGLPTDAGASHRGAVMGPAALRVAELSRRLGKLGYAVKDLGDLAVQSHLPAADQIQALAKLASEAGFASLGRGALPIFLGGDHSISMGTVAGVARHCRDTGKPLFVIWIDAHGDFNTPATSETGNIHGMSLALLCGEPVFSTEPAWFAPVDDPAQVAIFGARSLDQAERDLIVDRGIELVDMREIDERGVVAPLREFLDLVVAAGGHLHVSLDVDVLDPAIAPGVGTAVPGGLTFREAHLIMEMLHDSGCVGSLDVVELNPFLDHAGRSAVLLVDLCASLFGQTIIARPPASPGRR
jgi:arginase